MEESIKHLSQSNQQEEEKKTQEFTVFKKAAEKTEANRSHE